MEATGASSHGAATVAGAGVGQQIEPFPFHLVEMSPLAREKSDLKKPPQQGGGADSAAAAGLSKSEPSDKELLACLSKMTDHSITDDNPFEPIPIATGATDTGKKESSSSMDVSSAGPPSYTFGQDLNDESEQGHEFAEG